MNIYARALVWAAAIIGVAVAGMLEIIDEDSMTTLLLVLPLVAWMSLCGRACCLPRRV